MKLMFMPILDFGVNTCNILTFIVVVLIYQVSSGLPSSPCKIVWAQQKILDQPRSLFSLVAKNAFNGLSIVPVCSSDTLVYLQLLYLLSRSVSAPQPLIGYSKFVAGLKNLYSSLSLVTERSINKVVSG